ncbi:plasmid recombination protein [Pseudoalteromonas sp. 2CM32C]|uniref:plasmid recombination protein n=1 Tax=Pseudoalteromonas sp. 2CM32C TaxID=2929852 RepID=UPI0020BF628C|nr:plasmid recombination protein [Pseudoalteromonas sp. 2CM32C]MCK8120638.1 plasmid recombination protein [Pseudoalteromonas sp. 2CM32C]
MGKKYCAVNTKYYKNSNIGEIDHVLRNMTINVNAIECLTKNNFGFSFGNCNLKSHYQNKLEQAKKANNLALQKNSNTFIDSVLIFDSVQFEKCLNDGKKNEIEQATKNFMNEYKNLYGFEPIGFEFHLDEGTTIDFDKYERLDTEEQKKYVALDNPDEDFTTEYIKKNVHAHAVFLNYDFEQNKSCLRNMRKKDWENSQDLLHKHFKKFGFDRGEKKQTSKKDHKNKADFVRELELRTNELVENHSKNLQEKNNLLDQIIEHQNDLNRFDNLAFYAEKIKSFVLYFHEKTRV